SISTRIAETGLPGLPDATSAVGQFTVELLPGDIIVIPPEDGFTEICCTSTDEAPAESYAVAVIRYFPTTVYVCDADAPVTTVPSPKSITDLAALLADDDAVKVSAPLCDTLSETAEG